MTRKPALAWMWFALLWLLSAMVWALPPPAGQAIRNQVSASYRHEGTGQFETVYSNTVTLLVAAVTALQLEPDHGRTVLPGQSTAFAHRLTNIGNVASSIQLQLANDAGTDFALAELGIYLDSNQNGLLDPGEPLLSRIDLDAGESVALLVVARVPADVGFSRRSGVTLTASSGAATAAVHDRVRTESTALLTLAKAVAQDRAVAGDVLNYRLTLHNAGNQAAVPRAILVDGAVWLAIVVRDALPSNTQLLGVQANGGGMTLFHLPGAGVHEYTRNPPSLAAVDAVAFAFDAFGPDQRAFLDFSVRLTPLAGGKVINTAFAHDQADGNDRNTVSNPVTTELPAASGRLEYRDAPFSRVVTVGLPGAPLYLQAQAGLCNLDPSVIETVPVELRAERSGDIENGFVLTETGPGTGVFQLLEVPTRRAPPMVLNDGLMQITSNDAVTASITCQGVRLSTRLLIDPSGVVFDSRTGQLLAGATIRLVRIDASGVATDAIVRGFDGLILPNGHLVVTQADGRFQFPLVEPGNYRLDVIPPPGYSFASQVLPGALPPGFTVADGSYNRIFAVDAGTGAVRLDIPLDPADIPDKGGLVGFALDKSADRSTVGVLAAERVTYSLTLINGTGNRLLQVSIEDVLPPGFRYVPGSARLEGQLLPDPAGSPGPVLRFALPNLDAGQRLRLTYAALAGVTAPGGPARNRATARSDRGSSNTAIATVNVDRDVFSSEAMILGKVYVDCDRNRMQDPEELGIPGVRLYLDDGTFAVTDAEGKYSFYGVRPKTHTLKLDPITLPPGAEMRTSGNRNAGDPHSLFVDPLRGELARADFIEGSCAAPLIDAVKARRAKGEVFASELDRPIVTDIAGDTLQVDPKTRPSSGQRKADGSISAYQPILFEKPEPKLQSIAAPPAPRLEAVALDAILPSQQGNALAFMDLRDGQTLLNRDVNVRIVGPDGVRLLLSVNGEALPESRVGQKAAMPTRRLLAWEYIAVRLKPGRNLLTATVQDGFGNLREQAEITLVAPADLGRIKLVTPPEGSVADGQTPARVLVRLEDAAGLKVGARTPLTLEASQGRWQVTDLNPKEPGVQVFVEGGEGFFDLIPPAQPGEARVRATSGILKDEQLLAFKPQLRPLVVSGIVEGAVGLSRLKQDDLASPTAEDQFQQELKELSRNSDGTHAGLRGSLFIKGKVRGDRLLTLAYDSDKDTRDRLFRDIEPERFYPVYGDSGIKGFDAQSSSPLYVRVDQGRSYLLYGDYTTGAGYQVDSGTANAEGAASASNLERRLSNYQRSLTGVRMHVEDARTSVNLFAAYDNRRQQVIELRGRGTSGPYPLNLSNLARNSEKVEIVVRDRNQPAVVISNTLLTRFSDYSLDALDGSLLFTRAIPSVDEQLNPVFIRISLEVESGGQRFWVYGGDAQYRLSERIELGANVAREDAPDAANALYGANIVFRLTQDSYAVAELAHSQGLRGDGNAARVEWVNRGQDLDARVYAVRADANFENPQGAIASGRTEAGFKARYRLSDTLLLGGEGLFTRNDDTQQPADQTRGVLGYLEIAFSPEYAVQLGARRVLDEPAGGGLSAVRTQTTSVRVKPSWTPAFLRGKGSIYGEYEQDVSDASQRLMALGGSYQLASRGRAYLRHEFESNIGGPYDLASPVRQRNQTVLGLDYDYTDRGSLFSEYRVRDGISAREGEAALGLRNRWTLGTVQLQTSLERIQPMTADSRRSTAVTLGAEYLADPLTKLFGRLEVRAGDGDRSILNSLGIARKLDADWTLLGRNLFSLNQRSGERLMRDRLRVGAAYRDTDTNHWMWLGRYELRLDDERVSGLQRQAHVLSSSSNWHPRRPFTLTSRYAAKWVQEDGNSGPSSAFGQLITLRSLYDIAEKVDISLAATLVGDEGFDEARYGLGIEMGYLLTSNLWVSLGYNWLGYEDADLNDVDYTRQGLYLRLRYKFDEDLLQWLE